jgi:serine/threonine-protein kinase
MANLPKYNSLKVILFVFFLLGNLMGCAPSTTESETAPTKTKNDSPAAITPAPVPPNWKEISGEGVSLSLPASYEGGNPGKEIDTLGEKLGEIKPEYSDRVEPIKQRTKAIVFLAFDPKNAEQGTITNVSIIKEELPENQEIQEIIDSAAKKISLVYKLVNQETVTINGEKVGKINAQADSEGTLMQVLLYLVPREETLWVVSYTTTAEEFGERSPDFEESIRTFRVVKESDN